jgi:hypothetical protein
MLAARIRTRNLVAVSALGVAATFFSVLFVVSPLGGDTKVTLGAASQARYHGGWPGGTLEAWDLRGFGNKTLMYWLDRIATGLGTEPGSIGYEMAIKGCGLLGVLGIAALTASVVRLSFVTTRLHRVAVFLTLVLSYTTLSASMTQMQAEATAAMLAVFGGALVTRDERWAFPLAGAVTASTVLFKGVTVLTGVAGLLAAMVYIKDRRLERVVRVGMWFIGSFAIIVLLFFLFARQEITDLMDATLFQSSFTRLSVSARAGLVRDTFLRDGGHVPIALVGMAAFVVGAILPRSGSRYFGSEHRRVVGLVAVWLAASGFVASVLLMIQALGYPYHLSGFIPFGVAAVGFACQSFATTPLRSRTMAASIASILGIVIMVVPAAGLESPWATRSTGISVLFDSAEADRGFQSEFLDEADVCEGTVLFLDDGRAAYFLRRESELRYVYPLPLQRRNEALVDSDLRREVLAQAEEYSGMCIALYEGWISAERQPWLAPLLARIEAEYERVDFGGLRVLYVRSPESEESAG